MSKDLIRYDLLVQEALKGVVRKLLQDAARDGLPGEHHFYVSFRTAEPGVRLSQRMREEYPEEMTVVLQHQFWDLNVTEHAFEVGLSFRGVPERLLVPFDAITGFFDPSVQFGLKFEAKGETAGETAGEAAAGAAAKGEIAEAPPPKAPRLAAAPKLAEKSVAENGAAERDSADKEPAKPVKAAPKGEKAPAAAKADAAEKPDDGGAQVVSLDAFRKKP